MGYFEQGNTARSILSLLGRQQAGCAGLPKISRFTSGCYSDVARGTHSHNPDDTCGGKSWGAYFLNVGAVTRYRVKNTTINHVLQKEALPGTNIVSIAAPHHPCWPPRFRRRGGETCFDCGRGRGDASTDGSAARLRRRVGADETGRADPGGAAAHRGLGGPSRPA